ncbi:receptor activity-modifying protein 1-like [Stigmatopora nigra]
MRLIIFCMLEFVFFSTGLSETIIYPCDKHLFDSNVQICRSAFNKSMETSDYRHGCAWPTVKRIYYDLTHCVNHWALVSLCQSRGSLMDDFFLQIHRHYFATCGQVQDPPLGTIAMLTAPPFIAVLLMPLFCLRLTTGNVDVK